MAMALCCSTCGAIIGVTSDTMTLAHGAGAFGLDIPTNCEGVRDAHPKAIETNKKRLFGLVTETTQIYPETSTTSTWVAYIGPKSKFLLFAAIMRFGSVLVNHKWAWWEWSTGFFGDGVEELGKFPLKAQ